ncbi:MAG: hypothetical protein NVSMB51_06620 [Solirubrobacteraceae bacterium]
MSEAQPPGPVQFEVTVEQFDAGSRVSVIGELDLVSVEEFEHTLRAQLATGPVRLDLAGVLFMDSSGVRALDALLRDQRRHGWQLSIDSRLQPGVRQILDMTCMTDVLPFDEREERRA